MSLLVELFVSFRSLLNVVNLTVEEYALAFAFVLSLSVFGGQQFEWRESAEYSGKE